MKPQFAREGLGYALRMPDVATELRVARLVMSRGELSGELTVECGLPAIASQDGHVFRGRFNLSSPTTRNSMAKHLASRTNGVDFDWPAILEALCVRVLNAEGEGAPFSKVGRMPTPIGQPFRLDPFLPLGKPTILFGDGGVGKSYMAVGVAVSVMTGETVLPGFKPAQCPVLYLDWETDAADIDGRVKAVSEGVEVEAPEIGYRAAAGPLAGQIEDVAAHVARERVGLVIVDSMAGALGVTSESGDANESVVRLFTALRHLDTTVLVIDHVSKEGAANESGAFKPYGSAYKVNLARSVWELRRGRDSDGETVHLGLYHRKSNNSRLRSPIGLAFRNEDGKRVTWGSEALTEPSLAKGATHWQRIYEMLRAGPATDQEIADETDIDVKKVRVYLSRGKQRGVFAKDLTTGNWALAEVRRVV